MSRSSWKSPYVKLTILELIKTKKDNLYLSSKNSTIVKAFVGLTFYIYQGHKYIKLKITTNMVNSKFGEFIFTRKIGHIHKINKK